MSSSIKVVTSAHAALQEIENLSYPRESLIAHPPSLQLFWLKAFLRHYGADRKLAITFVDNGVGGRVIAAFQLLDTETIAFVCDETCDFNDFFCHDLDDLSVRLLIEFWLSSGVKRFILRSLARDSKTIPILRNTSRALTLEFAMESCDTLAIVRTVPDSPVIHWPGVDVSRIRTLWKKFSHLSERCSVSLQFIETKEELVKWLPAAMQLHVERWEGRGQRSKFLDLRRRKFTEEVCHEALNRGELFFSTLIIDGNLSAYRLGFRSGSEIFAWNTSFSVNFSRFSPGSLHLLLLLSSAQKLGFTKYNFMRGKEPHKFYWTRETEETVAVRLTTN